MVGFRGLGRTVFDGRGLGGWSLWADGVGFWCLGFRVLGLRLLGLGFTRRFKSYPWG